MKNIILASLFIIATVSAYAQKANVPGPDLQEKAAGYELVKATKHFYTGAIVFGAGTVLDLIGLVQASQPGSNRGGGFVLLGDIGVITGFVFIMESYAHIGRAGKILMQRNDLTLRPTPYGIGIVSHL